MNIIKYTIFFFTGILIVTIIFQFLSKYGWILIFLIAIYLIYIGIKNFLKNDEDNPQSKLKIFENQININKNTILKLKNENLSLTNQVSFLTQQLENKKQNSQQVKNVQALPFQNITKIPNRRPFNIESFQIEKDIALILSDEIDVKGKALVNLVIKMIEKMGYYAIDNDGLKDKGKDILVYKDKSNNEPFMAIQCKSYSPQKNNSRTTAEEVSKFNGHIADKFKKQNRIFISSSYFEKEAINENLVTLIDRIGLIHLFLEYFPEETINVLNSNSLHKITDTCQKCGHGKLQKIKHTRNNKPTNTAFYCTNCHYKYDKIKEQYTSPKYKKES